MHALAFLDRGRLTAVGSLLRWACDAINDSYESEPLAD